MREKIVLIFAAILVLIPISAHADIITNGSFEDTNQAAGTWDIYSSILGWTTTSGSGIEVRNNVYGIAQDGDNFVELDARSNSAMSQTVDTVAGSQYTLSYYYAPRIGVASGSNDIELYFNDVLVDSFTAYSDFNNAWSFRSFIVTGTGEDTIMFQSAGISDSLGGSIDNVSMELVAPGPSPVPEPSSLLLLGSGLGTVGIAAWRRRK